MTEFLSQDLRRFLKAVDSHLDKPFEIRVIGGAAASLAYKSPGGTMDIDTANAVAEINKACAEARESTGLKIPVSCVGGALDGPDGYEERLEDVPIEGSKKLRVRVPEKHDWALMKVVRFDQKDMEDIKEVSDAVGFDRDTLLKRLLEEMDYYALRKRLVGQFLTMIEELYGEEQANRMQTEISNRWK